MNSSYVSHTTWRRRTDYTITMKYDLCATNDSVTIQKSVCDTRFIVSLRSSLGGHRVAEVTAMPHRGKCKKKNDLSITRLTDICQIWHVASPCSTMATRFPAWCETGRNSVTATKGTSGIAKLVTLSPYRFLDSEESRCIGIVAFAVVLFRTSGRQRDTRIWRKTIKMR